jgi:ubiquinone/menaquinone biosynthesis C-methylase UbiE
MAEHRNSEQKDRDLFNDIADKYSRKDYAKSSSIIRQYQLFFALGPVLKTTPKLGTIVEIACGIGAPARYLDGLYEKYVGIDYSEQQNKAGRRFNQGNSKASFVTANIKEVDLPETQADLIFAIGALHHMTEHEKVFAALRRLAKPGAYFVAIEPHRGNVLVQFMRWARAKLDKGYSDDQEYYLEDDLRSLLVKGGLVDIEIAYEGYLSPPLAQVVIPPQFITARLSYIILTIDRFLDRNLPSFAKKLSWNIVARGKFPRA